MKNKKVRRKKKPAPVIKFVLIFIFVSFFGVFILYFIDNPLFLENVKNKIFSFRSSSFASSSLPSSQLSSSSSSSSSSSAGPSSSTTTTTTASSTSQSSVYTLQEKLLEKEGEEEKDRLKDSSLKEETTSDRRQGGGLWKTISLRIQEFFEKIRGKSNEGETFPSKLTINAYFCSLGEDSKLVGEKRTIIAGEVNTAVLNAMNELLKGPVKSYHFPVIPAGTKILGVEVYENVAKLNLSQEFLENSLDTRILDEYIIYSIVNTLTEIPGVDGVIFYIDGKKINVYGNLDLSVPIIKNEELIGK